MKVSIAFDWPYGEDVIVAGKRTFGVIDGATPVGGSHTLLVDYVRRLSFYLTKNEKVPLRSSLEYALSVTFDPGFKDSRTYERPSAAAAVVRVFDDGLEIFRAADSVAVVETDGGFVVYDDNRIDALDRRNWEKARSMYALHGDFERALREVGDDLRATRELMGVEYFPLYPGVDVEKLYWYRLEVDGVRRVYLMTDGFYRYFSVFGGGLDELGPGTLHDILSRLRKIEESFDRASSPDPLFKLHDDATAVCVELRG